jgi:hypothetical protein
VKGQTDRQTDRQIHMVQTAELRSAETFANPSAHRTLRCDSDWLYKCVFRVPSRVFDGSAHTIDLYSWYDARCLSSYWILTYYYARCPFYLVPEHESCRNGMPRRVRQRCLLGDTIKGTPLT